MKYKFGFYATLTGVK